MTETSIVTTQEGISKLKELEDQVKENLKSSRSSFNQAMFSLVEIRDQGLWVYARDEDGVLLMDYERPRFKEDYLYLFCRRAGIGISSTYTHLGTVEVMHFLGWSDDKIADIGVRELKPVQTLVRIDGRSGEVKLPAPEVIDKLPPGETVQERISKKVEEVFIDPPEPLSVADRVKALSVDTGAAPDVRFFEAGDGSVWYSYTYRELCWDGELIPPGNYAEIDGEAKQCLVKKLKIQEYPRRNNDGKDD